MRIAIHQPNFVPWWPFFEKMASVDRFIVLTHCQFNREHFQHRFKFQERWHTMGVQDVRHIDSIRNRIYANPARDWAKIKQRLPKYKSWFEEFDDCIQSELWRTNFSIILRIAEQLKIRTEILIDPIPSCTGTDRLIEICRASSATTYVAGRSGASYMDLKKFAQAGIKVQLQTVTDTRHVFEL